MDDGKNFTGLVGDLFNGYSDIGWANLFFSLQRSQFIDYTDPYMLDYGGFMVILVQHQLWIDISQKLSPLGWET